MGREEKGKQREREDSKEEKVYEEPERRYCGQGKCMKDRGNVTDV